jgi:hypothetical protein
MSVNLISGAAAIYDNGAPTDPNVPQSYQVGGRWSNIASGATGAVGTGITLTWSIAPDGTSLGSGNGETDLGSTFIAKMNSLYGSQATWQPIVQSVFDSWSAVSGITYKYEPKDDGIVFSTSNRGILGTRGDIRIGSHPVDGTFSVLAYNWFPSFGDMIIDADDLTGSGFMTNKNSNSLRLRNVLAHEHGHGLGLNHVDPINNTKLMEAFASTSFDGPQFDDILAIQKNYGDFYEKGAANNSTSTAADRGILAAGATDFVNNLSLSNTSDTDVFKFTIASTASPTFTLTPAGNPYLQGPQGGATSTFDPRSQMNLQFQLLDASGQVVNTVAGAGVGAAETLTLSNLAAGTYYIKVLPESGATGNTQMYTLTTQIPSIAAPTPTTNVALDGSKNLTITDSASGGKNDVLTVSADTAHSRYVITDSVNYLSTAISGATGSGTHTVYVPFSAVTGTKVSLSLDGGMDSVTITGTKLPVTVDAGSGTDTINIVETAPSAPVTIAPATGNDAVSINTDNTGTASAIFNSGTRIGAFTIGTGGSAAVAKNAGILQVDSLGVAAGGKLDLNNNDVVVNTGSAAALQALAFTGYSETVNAGKTGIISTAGQTSGLSPIHVFIDNAMLNNLVWNGVQVGASAIIGHYTIIGDTDLNGVVTPDDYIAIDSNLGNRPSAGLAYFNGDMNFDGVVTPDDYLAIDSNLGRTLA